ncbi:MAG: phospholipase D-like domain-containing protein [Proteobacteria bacterium]|nr:phospholipase D-like domain-containing protein [Pseudomonadota bacterium]
MADFLPLLVALHFAIAVAACVHIILTKAETPAIGWIGLVLVSPFFGTFIYWIFGINRVSRRARRYRGRRRVDTPPNLATHDMPFKGLPTPQQRQLFQFARSVHNMPFLGGNHVVPLVNAEGAYPNMLAAIAEAKHSIALSVYIFDCDEVGLKFIEALTAAHHRGVKVRVLLDEIGSGKWTKPVDKLLSAVGIATARFIPQNLKFLPFINLRNHRKIMVVDGRLGYIGGMNICLSYAAQKNEEIHDLHFRVSGPVIAQLNAMFEEDWKFATDEAVELPLIECPQEKMEDPVYARAIPDGPDNSAQRTQWVILGALAVAQKSVHVLTPYFLPNEVLTNALGVCAMRGVSVQVVVPSRTDIALVDWAMEAKFQYLLEHGVQIYRSPPPFDHTKLMIVDGVWTLVGSSNWDQRSLRLNFEANLECYDGNLGQDLETHFDSIKKIAKAVTVADVVALPVPRRLRNNFARLFAPYL